MDIKAAASQIRDLIDPDFAAKTARDAHVIDAVTAELGLEDNPANRFQVAAALAAKGVSTRREYPKTKYHHDKPFVVVANEDEEAALGSGWTDQPAEGAVAPDYTVPKADTPAAAVPAPAFTPTPPAEYGAGLDPATTTTLAGAAGDGQSAANDPAPQPDSNASPVHASEGV